MLILVVKCVKYKIYIRFIRFSIRFIERFRSETFFRLVLNDQRNKLFKKSLYEINTQVNKNIYKCLNAAAAAFDLLLARLLRLLVLLDLTLT